MLTSVSAFALAALVGKLAASPVPQATVTVLAPPPGMIPNASYVALGTGTAGDVTFIGQRIATVSGVATTVYDGLDLGPSEVAIVEADASGSVIQALDCMVSGSLDICGGQVISPSTTYAYQVVAPGSTAVVTGYGLTALPTDAYTLLAQIPAQALSISAQYSTYTSYATLSALPGFVGDSSASTDAAAMSGATAAAPVASDSMAVTSVPAAATMTAVPAVSTSA